MRAAPTAAIAAIVLVELGLACVAIDSAPPIEDLLLAHVAIAVLLFPLSALAWAVGIRAARFYLLALSLAVAGPLGAAGWVMMVVLERFHSRRSVSFEQWHAAFFADPGRDPVEALADRLAWSGAAARGNGSVTSFADVMKAGTIAQKQSVLALVADHFQPAYAGVLRGALNDPEPVIRVQAASVAARLEDGFQKRGAALRQCLERDSGNARTRADLARFYRDSGRAKLADDFSAAAQRREGLELLDALAAEFPPDDTTVAARAELLLENGQPDAAAELLHPLAQAADPDPDLALTCFAALLGARRFDDMRHLAGRLRADAGRAADCDELRPVLALWAPPHALGGASG